MFRGTLDDFTLPEILRMLAFSKKTGTLKVSRRAGNGRVTFRDGKVVYAETELSSSRLGQKLVAAGKLAPTKLRQCLDTQATTGDRLGRILLADDAVTRDDLEEAIRAQIEDSAYELMCWEAGEFTWEPGAQEGDETEVALDVDDLMLDVTGRLQEQDQMKRRLEAPGAVPQLVQHPAQGPGDINISPQQWRVLVLVDGKRTVDELAEAAGLPASEAAVTLHDLVVAGLIEVAAAAEPEPAEAAAEPVPETPAPVAVAPDPVIAPEPAVAATPAPATAAHPAFAAAPAAPAAPAPAENGSGPDEEAPPDEWFEDPEVVGAGSGLPVAFPPPQPAVEDLPRVDRAAAVRELSGLFDEPKAAPKPPPPAPDTKKTSSTEAAANAKSLIGRFGRRPS